MDTTFVVNPGSASKKYALYEGGTCRGVIRYERIDDRFERRTRTKDKDETVPIDEDVFRGSLRNAETLMETAGLIHGERRVTRVGVRSVVPGTYFGEHRRVDDDFMAHLDRGERAAPLHGHTLRSELDAARAYFPDTPIVAVSDSAFHATIPHYHRLYGIRREDIEALDIYRFGYHGLSVASVARQAASTFGSLPRRMVVAHIGSGISVSALLRGVSQYTTMGFTPTSGLMMGTRAGDIDPGALLYLMAEKNMSIDDARAYLMHDGGFMGLAGTYDLRLVLERYAQGDERSKEALLLFIHEFVRTIGASAAVLGGIDAIALTATAMERNSDFRALLMRELYSFDVLIDDARNAGCVTGCGVISATDSSVAVAVIPTDEMGEIARIAHEVALH